MELIERPAQHRVKAKLLALGPYLRPDKSTPEQYFFDCLAVCRSAKAELEQREFWGWFLYLEATDTGFEYRYEFGLYDSEGQWSGSESPPQEYMAEVKQTLDDFYQLLHKCVSVDLKLSLTCSEEENANEPLSAA